MRGEHHTQASSSNPPGLLAHDPTYGLTEKKLAVRASEVSQLLQLENRDSPLVAVLVIRVAMCIGNSVAPLYNNRSARHRTQTVLSPPLCRIFISLEGPHSCTLAALDALGLPKLQ
jgi:hypothetical protein